MHLQKACSNILKRNDFGRLHTANMLFLEITMNLVNFLRDENGVTAIEYGLIAALIAVAIIAALNQLGTSLTNNFNEISTNMDAAI